MITEITNLPILCQIYIIASLAEDEFYSIRYIKEFAYLFDPKQIHRQRIYEERIRKYYAEELIEIKTSDLKWDQFYYSLCKIVGEEIDLGFMTSRGLVAHLSLIEFKLIKSLHPKLFDENSKDLIDLYIHNYSPKDNSLDIIKWLLDLNIFPTEYYVYQAVQNENYKVLQLLHERDYEFYEYHFQSIVPGSEMYEWFSQRNYVVKNMWTRIRNEETRFWNTMDATDATDHQESAE